MNNFLFIANYFYNFGFNVTCITNEVTDDTNPDGPILKNPCHKWHQYSTERQDLDVLRTYPWEKAKGIGVVLGYNQLRALDIDGCNDFSILGDFLKILRLPSDYKWVVISGSQKGFHIIFNCNDHYYSLIKNKIKVFKSNEKYEGTFDKIELRWVGHLVLPPSIHPSINEYKFWNLEFPQKQPNKIFADFVHELIQKYCAFHSIHTISLLNNHSIESYEEDHYLEVSGSGCVIEAPYYVFFDTETTGKAFDFDLPPSEIDNWPRLVQLSWIICDRNGHIITKHSEIIKPEGYTIPLEASEIHGITTEKALREGKKIEEILWEFTTLGGKRMRYLVGHNVKFDINVIQSEFYRLYQESPEIDINLICTMIESTSYCKIGKIGRYKWPKLEELYKKLFQSGYENKHDASADAEATMRCYLQLRDLGILKRPKTLIEKNFYPFFEGKIPL